MGITSAIVLYAVIWFLTLLCVLPIRLETQGDAGEIVPGTHAGSPTNPQLKKRFLVTTGVALVVWAIVAALIFSGWFTLERIENFVRWIAPME